MLYIISDDWAKALTVSWVLAVKTASNIHRREALCFRLGWVLRRYRRDGRSPNSPNSGWLSFSRAGPMMFVAWLES
jgi:hypothetical protein